MRRATHILIAFWLVAAGLACAPQVDVPRWDPIDPGAVRAAVENPTARFTADPDLEALMSALVGGSTATDVDAAMGQLQEVLDRTAPTTGGTGGDDDPASASGTVVFLEIACPGPDPDMPDRSFRFGEIRLDSARLTRDVIENLLLEGDVLLSFRDCSAERRTYNGTGPSFYEAGDAPQVLTSLDLEVLDEITGDVEPFVTDAIFEPMRSRFVQPSAGGGTYTLELDSASGQTALHGADGDLVCVTATGVCTGP